MSDSWVGEEFLFFMLYVLYIYIYIFFKTFVFGFTNLLTALILKLIINSVIISMTSSFWIIPLTIFTWNGNKNTNVECQVYNINIWRHKLEDLSEKKN